MRSLFSTLVMLCISASIALQAQSGKTLYTQHFSTGALPAGWSAGSETGNPFTWSFSNPLARVAESPSAYNGFAIADRAYFGNVLLKAVLSSAALDFSANTKVYLEFYQLLEGVAPGDTAEVQVSGDNGVNWTSVMKISTATSGTIRSAFDLSAQAAGKSQVKVRFRFVANHDAWWIFDDLRFYTLHEKDLGITEFVSPATGCSLGSSETVSLRVKNYGLLPIDTCWLGYGHSGYADVYEKATLLIAPGEEKEFSFTGKADLSVPGKHTMSANLILDEDSDAANNSIGGYAVYSLQYDINSTAYSTGFEGVGQPSIPLYTALDEDGDGHSWLPGTSSGQAHDGSNGYLAADMREGSSNWLFSHCFQLSAGQVYTISFWNESDETYTTDKLSLYIGDSPLPAAMNRKIMDVSLSDIQSWQQSTLNFTVPASGTWYLGWHAARTEAQYSNIKMDDVSLSKAAAHDLGVVSLNLSGSGCYPDSVPLRVAIYNLGMNPESGFFISCRVNSSSWLTEMVTVPVNPMDTFWYTFSKPLALIPGYTANLEMYTILATDENASNDKLTKSITNGSYNVFNTPFYYGFESNEDPDAMSLINGNNDSYDWWAKSSPRIFGNAALVYQSYVSAEAHEWALINKCLYLQKGVAYKFSYYYRNSAFGYSLDFYLGNSPDTLQMKALIKHMNLNKVIGGYTSASFSFGVPEDGIYYLGFLLNGTDPAELALDNLLLNLGSDNDLAPVGLLSPQTSCELGDTAIVTGAFVNLGNVPVSNFYVGYNVDGTLMEKVLVPGPLAPMDTFIQVFSEPLTFEYSSEKQVVLFTQKTDDPYTDNDYFQATVEKLSVDLEQGSYNTDFNSYDAKYYSLIDGNKDGNSWKRNDYNGGLSFESQGMPADETIISRCMALKAGQIYTVKFRPEITSRIPEFRVLLGTGNEPAAMTLIRSWRNLFEQFNNEGLEPYEYTAFFTVPADGIYQLGLQILGSTTDYFSMYLRYLQVYKAVKQDAAVVALLAPATACNLGASEPVRVQLANLGSLPLENPVLQVCLDPSMENGTCTQMLEESYEGIISPYDTVEFTFAGTLDLAMPGYHKLDLSIATDPDEDYSNNRLSSIAYSGIDFMQGGYYGYFYSEASRNEWTILDANEDGRGWNFGYDMNVGSLAICPVGAGETDDWLFTRCLNFKEGNYYKVLFNAWSDQAEAGISLHFGQEQNPAGMTQPLLQIEHVNLLDQQTGEANQYAAYIHCMESGIYYLGLHAQKGAAPDSLRMNFLSIAGKNGQDLATIALLSPVSGCGIDAQLTVRAVFSNLGGDTLRDIPVYYVCNESGLVQDTLSLLLPGEDAAFEFSRTIDSDALGESFTIDLWGKVPGDDVPGNDSLHSGIISNFSAPSFSRDYSMGFEEGELAGEYYLGVGANRQIFCSYGMVPPHSGSCALGVGDLYSTTINGGFASHCFKLLGGREYTLEYFDRLVLSDNGISESLYLATSAGMESIQDTLLETTLSLNTYESRTVSFTPKTSGTYYLVWEFDGQYSAFNGILVDDISLKLIGAGVPDRKPGTGFMLVYPNPARNHVYLLVPGEAGRDARAELLNLLGEPVRIAGSLKAGDRLRIDLSGLSAGSYLLLLKSTEGSWQQKIIIR